MYVCENICVYLDECVYTYIYIYMYTSNITNDTLYHMFVMVFLLCIGVPEPHLRLNSLAGVFFGGFKDAHFFRNDRLGKKPTIIAFMLSVLSYLVIATRYRVLGTRY